MELAEFNDTKPNNKSPYIVIREETTQVPVIQSDSSSSVLSPHEAYRLYKRRWLGLAGICLLNVVSGLNWLWFSSIAINTSQEFGISLDTVNWLGNSVSLVYLPVSLIVPMGFSRWGLRISCVIGSLGLLVAAWVRYAGTTQSLSPASKYTLLLIGQVFTGFAQPWFQILGPKYSETWFDLRGRTVATMIIAISNPIGGALSQLLAPVFSTVTESVLYLAIITSAVAPIVILIASKPPIPPTYSASLPSPPAAQLLRALIGKARSDELFMSFSERMDMAIITLLFARFS
ncbi:hypothetical protein RSAG8_09144, partial [Rhizoctonia solani AG-8 WAC10335]